MKRASEITELLLRYREGDERALEDLFPLVYQQLKRMARRRLRAERAGHTLNTTALVHEAYLKLAKFDHVAWKGRAHFFAFLAQVMRNVLVDYAQQKGALKRGGASPHVELESDMTITHNQALDLLELDKALRSLEAVEPRYGKVVECRFFAGMTIEETARAMELSPATVKRDWTFARAWLQRELDPPPRENPERPR